MTRDDIIRMAQDAGFNQILATIAGADVWIDDGFYVKEMERFAALVAAAEREACAKVCEDYTDRYAGCEDEGHGYEIAAAIRAKGEA